MNIPIFNTYIDKKANKYLENVLKSTFLSEGKLVKKFEKKLVNSFDFHNITTVNSGTSALHLALVLAGIKENDEVIMPAQTFIATGMVVIQQKAKIVFADIQYETGNICPKSIQEKITEKTKAIIVVHWGGYPCDMDEINEIAKKKNLIVIEDAAHALGATYKNKIIGNISDYTCFSFQAIKHLTTGDGGAICVSDENNIINAKKKRWFGINRENLEMSFLGERTYNVTELGFKYHLNDYAAALGLANLLSIQKRLKHIENIADFYRENLQNIAGIQLFEQKNDRTSANWLFGMHVENRENFVKKLQEAKISASVVHLGIDKNEIFGGKKEDLIQQRKFDATQIHIPIHYQIDMKKAKYIIEIIKKGW